MSAVMCSRGLGSMHGSWKGLGTVISKVGSSGSWLEDVQGQPWKQVKQEIRSSGVWIPGDLKQQTVWLVRGSSLGLRVET